MPPAAASVTAAYASSTDSGLSRSSASLTTFTPATLHGAAAGSGVTTPLADLAHDRRRAYDSHGGAGSRDPRVLLRQPATGNSVMTSALFKQHLEGLLVGNGGLPAPVPERPAADYPRVDHVVQV